MQVCKIYIIRLKNNIHSCSMASDCIKQANYFGYQVDTFDAIDGDDVERHYQITKVPKPKKSLKKGSKGVLGCFFSHYYLWQKCIELDAPLCILEHDGYFIKPMPEDILTGFTDICKLDDNDPYSSRYNEIISKEANKKHHIKKYINRNPKAIHKIGTGNYFKGAYSYIIKPSGAKKLINFIHSNRSGKGHRPADQQIGDAVLHTSVCTPTIARLHPFYSRDDNIKSYSLTSKK